MTARAWLLAALGRRQERLELACDDLLDDARDRRRAEHLLGLPLELRLGQPHRHHRGQAVEHVVLDDLVVALLEQAGRAARVERLGQRPLEARTCVPPLGVAMMLTNERTSVS